MILYLLLQAPPHLPQAHNIRLRSLQSQAAVQQRL